MEPILQLADEFDENLTLDLAGKQETELKHQQHEDEDDDGEDDDESEDDEFEFFVGGGDLNSPVSAEEVFENGQIRPIFPFSDDNSDEATTSSSSCGPPVKKLFVVSDDVAEGPYCAWSKEKSSMPALAPEMSQKSNSTGFSKLWRVRDLLVRSHSDGKDAFVFLTGKGDDHQKVGMTTSEKKKKTVNVPKIKIGNESERVEKKGKGKKQVSAYEVLYGKREKKAGKSYLPYRQDLVGFFTNANGGMSRNVHPY